MVPFLQNKGTAADDLIGICAVLVAVLFNVILAAGENIGVGKETGVRAVKGNYKVLSSGAVTPRVLMSALPPNISSKPTMLNISEASGHALAGSA